MELKRGTSRPDDDIVSTCIEIYSSYYDIMQQITKRITMYHYTYEITYTNNTKYIGVRTSKCIPEEDTKYIGSSKYTPNDKIFNKLILRIFPTRKLALEHERYLQQYNNVVKNPLYHNRAIQLSTGFDTTGLTFVLTQEHKDKIAKASTGRVKSPKERAKLSASKLGIPLGPKSEAAKLAISKANKSKTFKGRTYTARAYVSRLKYPNPFMWINNLTLEHKFCTAQELAHYLGIKVARLNHLPKGTVYSCSNWSLVHSFVHKNS